MSFKINILITELTANGAGTKTGRDTVLPGHCPQLTAGQTEQLQKRDGEGAAFKSVPPATEGVQNRRSLYQISQKATVAVSLT